MARIVGGIGVSHVPSVGVAFDKGNMQTPEWKPLWDGCQPARRWLERIEPDVAIVVYNDHGADFFFDKYPTFAVGAADRYAIGDEGFGIRPLPPLKGDAEFSWHLCKSLIYDEFDLTVCQEMALEHGFLVPMNLMWSHVPDWPLAVVPFEVNVIQHPLPTARRCYRLGQAIRRAVESYPRDLKVVILGTGGMSHQLNGRRFGHLNSAWDQWFLDQLEAKPDALSAITHDEIMRNAGAEAVELIMWLAMRGAMTPSVRRVHRHYYAPMTTGMGLLALEDA